VGRHQVDRREDPLQSGEYRTALRSPLTSSATDTQAGNATHKRVDFVQRCGPIDIPGVGYVNATWVMTPKASAVEP
jgi:hypothetical protein